MVSPTQQTFAIRRRKQATNGKSNKRHGRYPTPKFPIHPEGYDPNAADSRRVADEAQAQTKAQ